MLNNLGNDSTSQYEIWCPGSAVCLKCVPQSSVPDQNIKFVSVAQLYLFETTAFQNYEGCVLVTQLEELISMEISVCH